jgi:hypothetical protein
MDKENGNAPGAFLLEPFFENRKFFNLYKATFVHYSITVTRLSIFIARRSRKAHKNYRTARRAEL